MDLNIAANPSLQLNAIPSGFNLQKGGHAVFTMPMMADTTRLAKITMSIATPGGQSLARTLRMPIQMNDPEISRSSHFNLATKQNFEFNANVFSGLQISTNTTTLAIRPITQLNTAGLLQILNHYPYNCAKQVATATLPLLYLRSITKTMKLGHTNNLHDRVNNAIINMLARQNANNNFGL